MNRKIFILLIISVAISSCGFKGALYLPKNAPKNPFTDDESSPMIKKNSSTTYILDPISNTGTIIK